MFSNALKSISATNITGNYSIQPTPTSTAGPWKIYDAKKKSTQKSYSVFVFDRKSLDAHAGTLGRSSAAAFKRAADEVVQRLKKEALSLAKLRHPSVLELVEPVEEIRGGGLQFATEPVTASLSSLLQEKDDQERGGGVGGRSSRYVTEDADGNRRRREIEIDELEIQKGLLQISKALEFLHENAGLVHANLTPDAILVNAKGDWKISGLSFCSPPDNSTKATSFQPISLHETLNMDPRLPRYVQINLDYTSPDFVMDNNLTPAADMFSLGLLCVALYNSPHTSPLECNSSVSSYKRVFSSPSSVPSAQNNFCSARPVPRELVHHVLPRLITRRPAQRMTAKEFQLSQYFDNILVSTIRFLESFPAKTSNEKASFMRGLNKVLPSFPKSVMEKKVLPALLDEMKDKELVSLILQNVFKIIDLLPSSKRAFGEKVCPALKEHFITNYKPTQEKDPARDAGLMVLLERLSIVADNCSGKEFKDDILPIINSALDSPTPTVVDAALRSLPVILPVLDFSTIKNELFPVVAAIFSKTNSLSIKVRGLQAFVILCGGNNDPNHDDGLDGLNGNKKKTSSSSALDKYTMQEKIIPLVKAIKTKEPAVMMAALNVLRVVGQIADAEFVAMDILPMLWSMSLGPLLDLKQFQTFMELIKTLSRRVEDEQTKKLQELSGSNGAAPAPADDFMSFRALSGTQFDATNGDDVDDFELLVKGKSGASTGANPMDAGWDTAVASSTVTSPGLKSAKSVQSAPAFSWSTPSPTTTGPISQAAKSQPGAYGTVTPDLASFASLTPTTTQYSQPLQPSNTAGPSSNSAFAPPPMQSSNSWAASSSTTANPWAPSPSVATPSFQSSNPISPPAYGGGLNSTPQPRASGFSLAPPPTTTTTINTAPARPSSGFSLAPPPNGSMVSTGTTNNSMGSGYGRGLSTSGSSMGTGMAMGSMIGGNGSTGLTLAQQQQQRQQVQKPQQPQGGSTSGLDKYASLL